MSGPFSDWFGPSLDRRRKVLNLMLPASVVPGRLGRPLLLAFRHPARSCVDGPQVGVTVPVGNERRHFRESLGDVAGHPPQHSARRVLGGVRSYRHPLEFQPLLLREFRGARVRPDGHGVKQVVMNRRVARPYPTAAHLRKPRMPEPIQFLGPFMVKFHEPKR
jgi:hypothetical protein